MALSPDKYRQFVSRAKGYTEQWNKFIQSHLVRGNLLFNIRELKNMLRGEHLRYVNWVVPKLSTYGIIEIDGATGKYKFHISKRIHWSFLYEAIVVNNFDVKTYDNLPPHQKPGISTDDLVVNNIIQAQNVQELLPKHPDLLDGSFGEPENVREVLYDPNDYMGEGDTGNPKSVEVLEFNTKVLTQLTSYIQSSEESKLIPLAELLKVVVLELNRRGYKWTSILDQIKSILNI